MANLTFRSGDVQSVDYTPSADTAAGQVVVIGEVPMVSHVAIPEDELGALAAHGGVYRGITDGSLDTPGALVYWDAAEGEFVASSTGNTHFGYTLPNQVATSDQDEIDVIHLPARAGS